MENASPFNRQWQEAFQGAEAALPEQGWLSIDHALTRTENDRNKTRIVFYQRIAATLLLICLAGGYIIFQKWDSVSSMELQATDQSSITSGIDDKLIKDQNSGSSNIVTPVETKEESVKTGNSGKHVAVVTPQESLQSHDLNDSSTTISEQPELASTESLDEFVKQKSLTEEEEKELVKKLLGEEETIIPEKVKLKRSLWAAAGVSGGSYSAGSQEGSFANSALADLSSYASTTVQPVKKQPTIGVSYSLGLMAGKQFSKHWIVQAGVTYMKQQIDYESNITSSTSQGISVFDSNFSSGASNIAFTQPYTIRNTAEFISVPIQTGYMIIDRKIGLAVNTGVSTDFYLRSTLTDQSGNLSPVETSGDQSPYRPVSWSGLTNAELSVRIAEHYRLSLVPGIRYSLTNIMKDDADLRKPLVFEVGFRLRYIFK